MEIDSENNPQDFLEHPRVKKDPSFQKENRLEATERYLRLKEHCALQLE